MEHNSTVPAAHTAIHPATVHRRNSRLRHTDGPLLCHEISSVSACGWVLYVLCVHVCVTHSSGRWHQWIFDIFWCVTYENCGETTHMLVWQTEGRTEVCLSWLLTRRLKYNKNNIDAFHVLFWFPAFLHAASIAGESRVCFIPFTRVGVMLFHTPITIDFTFPELYILSP